VVLQKQVGDPTKAELCGTSCEINLFGMIPEQIDPIGQCIFGGGSLDENSRTPLPRCLTDSPGVVPLLAHFRIQILHRVGSDNKLFMRALFASRLTVSTARTMHSASQCRMPVCTDASVEHRCSSDACSINSSALRMLHVLQAGAAHVPSHSGHNMPISSSGLAHARSGNAQLRTVLCRLLRKQDHQN
jgi:hypothetical protein